VLNIQHSVLARVEHTTQCVGPCWTYNTVCWPVWNIQHRTGNEKQWNIVPL